MSANPNPAPPEKGSLSEPDTHALLRDCRDASQRLVNIWKAMEKFDKRTRYQGLIDKHEALIARIDAATLNTEGE